MIHEIPNGIRAYAVMQSTWAYSQGLSRLISSALSEMSTEPQSSKSQESRCDPEDY